MKPLEAWSSISRQIEELNRLRREVYPQSKGFSQHEITAQVVVFEALRRMEEGEKDEGN